MSVCTNPYPEQFANFSKNTINHRLQILHDDGLYRHLRMSAPNDDSWRWEITTWPGHLAITGDVADGYVFRRLQDMLDFFRADEHEGRYTDGTRMIDLGYWAQKLTRTTGADTAQRYSPGAFMQVAEQLIEEAVDSETISEQERPEMLDDARAASWELHQALGWLWKVAERLHMDPTDLPSIRDWDFDFLIACWAIAETVAAYDEQKEQRALEAAKTCMGSLSLRLDVTAHRAAGKAAGSSIDRLAKDIAVYLGSDDGVLMIDYGATVEDAHLVGDRADDEDLPDGLELPWGGYEGALITGVSVSRIENEED